MSTRDPQFFSSSYLPSSRIRSSRPIFGASFERLARQFPDDPVTGTESGGLGTLYQVLITLQEASVPGPVMLVSDQQYIGQGAQFVVYKQLAAWSRDGQMRHGAVATKQPKFDLDPEERLNLAGLQAKGHLDTISLEVKSLTTLRLRRHPNIVRLLGWAYQEMSVHQPLLLVLELAIGDLHQLLSDDRSRVSPWEAYLLCSGIAAGVDAIHQENVVHGDLKPRNILIFQESQGLVAKLADFGLSVGSGEQFKTDGAEPGPGTRLGGTPGWRAPEVERGEFLSPTGLKRADIYAFGLTAWATLRGSGESPPCPNSNCILNENLGLHQNEAWEVGLDHPGSDFLRSALPELLNRSPARRPERLGPLFAVIEPRGKVLESQIQGQRGGGSATRGPMDDHASFDLGTDEATSSQSTDPDDVLFIDERRSATYPWELPGLPSYFLDQLVSPTGNGQDLLPLVALASFLASTWVPDELPVSEARREPKVHLLLSAAARGCRGAQAIVPVIFAFYKLTIPASFSVEIGPWLEGAAASGSPLARQHVEQLRPQAFSRCIQEFQRNGGYSMYYTITPPTQGCLAWLAGYGTVEQLRGYLSARSAVEVDVNEKTRDGETPLYLACMRGSWEIAADLLNRSADASITCTAFQISCLHWLFAFNLEDQCLVAERLVENGAQINARVPETIPFPHYPFTLPPGTPLHWAVVTSSHQTIRVLVDMGADLNIRDRTDSYDLDHRIKIIDSLGLPQNHPAPDAPIQGLTPLDYAAMEHEPFIFEHLVSVPQNGPAINIDINSTDEEGLTVLHRLSAYHSRRTRTGTVFSCLPFRAKQAIYPPNSTEPPKQLEPSNLQKTVTAIRSLGGNMEQLTTPQTNVIRRSIGRLTPLTMATLGGYTDVVRALIHTGGANIHAVDTETGMAAINRLCENDLAAYEILRILIDAGADIHHRAAAGNTVLCGAAHRSMLAAMELLFEHGADVEETSRDPKGAGFGRSVFGLALTTRLDHPFDESPDERLAGMLVKYVLGTNEGVRRRVVENKDSDEQVLLHHYASRSMRHCVGVLLGHGAEVNPVAMRYTHRWRERVRIKVYMRRTPLDLAVEARERLERGMRESRPYTLAEYESLCGRADGVIKALGDAGGCRAAELGLGEDIEVPVS